MQQYTELETLEIREEEENFDLKKWLFSLLRIWPWFLVSIIICLFCSWFYLLYANHVYKAVASIMVKDDKKGNESNSNSSSKDMGFNSGNKSMENEIEILKSIDLMEAVVNKLRLYISVKERGRFGNVDVYDEEIPFALIIDRPDSIENSVKWFVSDTINGVVLKNEENSLSRYIRYDSEQNMDGISFRFIPQFSSYLQRRQKPRDFNKIYEVSVISPALSSVYYNFKLSVEAVNKLATVINLEINDNNQKRAIATLGALISIYTENGILDKNKASDSTIAFLNERLTTVALELEGVEGSVEKLKSDNRVTNLSSDAQQYLTLSQQVDVQKEQSQTQLNLVTALERYLEANKDDPQFVPSTLGLQEPSLSSLIEKHNELILLLQRMELKSGNQNPLTIDVQNQVNEIKLKLLSNVKNLKEAYTISLNDVTTKDEQLSLRLKGVPLLERKLVQITRNKNVQEQLYSFLLQKREEAAVNRAANIEDARTIVKARGMGPVSPKSKIAWLLGATIGLIIPILLMSIKSFFNSKVGDIKQIERKTNTKIIGSIPHVKKLRSPLVISHGARTAVSEQIRNIRSFISIHQKHKEVKTILVTSFQAGDGKSFASINLAAGYALLKKKSVILEFDLRKPRISKDLGYANGKGISNILMGKANPMDLLIKVNGYDDNLYLLPSGPLPPNPSELIAGKNFDYLFESLKEHFDYIIIDTPPFSIVADAALLQNQADVSLVVVRQDYTSREVYSKLNQLLHDDKNPVYVLLNDVKVGWQYLNDNMFKKYSYSKGQFLDV